MSLAVLADHMASKGRGPDSMLIHMSPREVQGLQALAMEHGGSLTINPHTGLPEAGFLDKLLPAIIGFAINTVAPGAGEAVAGLWGGAGGAAAGTAALVGGVQAARTGSIAEGVQAGLGAYGGANLAGGVASAGLPGAIDTLASTAGAEAERQALGQGLSAEAAQAIRAQAIEEAGNQATAQSVSRADVISKGFDAASKNPMQFAKDNWKSLAGIAVPAILAGENVKSGLPQTVTKPGEIHRFSYNPYNQFYTPAGNYEVPVKSAASGGIMGFDESSNSPMSRQSLSNMQDTGGMFNYAHDGGGIMKMAEGGLGSVAHYAIGGDTKAAIDAAYAAGDYAKVNELAQTNQITAADVADTYKGFDTSGLAGLGINLYNPNANTGGGNSYTEGGDGGGGAPIVNTPIVDTFNNNTPVVNAPTNNAPVVDTVAQDYWNDLAAKRDAAANAANQATWNQQNTDKWNAQNQATWAAQPVQYTDAQIGAYLAAHPNVDINQAIKDTRADPAAVNRYIASLTSGYKGPVDEKDINTKGTGTLGIYNQLVAQGIDPTEYYNAAIKNDPKYAGWSKADIERGYQIDKGIYAVGDQLKGVTADPKLGYDKQWVKFMDDNKYSALDMARATGLSIAEINKRYNDVKAAETKPVITCGAGYRLNAAGTACEPIPVVTPIVDKTCPSGYHWDATANACVKNIDATQNTSTNVTTPTDLFTAPSTSLPVGIAGNTGPSQIGGGATINPNGTITTSPRIPGIPVGGFTGMEQVRDAYTKGGGSLGYIPYAPKTMDDFNAKYNKLTGGSKAAYDYLTGKTKYSPVPVTETGEIMKPYAESVLGVPSSKSSKQYLFDPTTKKYALNPDYIPVSYTDKGEKVYGLSSKDIAAQLPDVPKSDYEKWMKDNNVTLAQIAQSLGISLAEAKKRYPTAKASDTATADASSGVDLSQNPAANGGLMGTGGLAALTMARGGSTHPPFFSKTTGKFNLHAPQVYGDGGMAAGGQFDLGSYSDGGRLLRGPGDGVSDSIPATIGNKRPARLADGEFVVPARIVSELGNGSTEAGARKLYAMMDRVQAARKGSIGKGKVANNSRADKYLPA